MSASRNRKYPEYKDSGRQWLKEIPSHWNTPKFGQVFRERRTKVSDKDFDALSVTKEGIVPQLATAAKTDHGDNRKLVLNGDFVINSRSDRKGSSGVSRLNGSVSTISIVLEILKGNNRYFHHLLRSHDFKEEFYRLGHGIVADLWSTRFDDIKSELLCFPPEKEQEQISDFLDFADKAIVDLVKSLEILLKLLEEKRSALITKAVTKGLNPNATMIESTITGLGSYPSHWKIIPTKLIAAKEKYSFVDGPFGSDLKNEEYVPSGVPLIQLNNIKNSSHDFSNEVYITHDKSDALSKHRAYPGDIVIAKMAEPVARACVVSEKYPMYNIVADCIRLKTKGVNNNFIVAVMNSDYYRIQAEVVSKGTTRIRINLGNLKNLRICLPPIDEQEKIAKNVLNINTQFDLSINHLTSEINLLKEYRTALISAAVTGKIDVRGQA